VTVRVLQFFAERYLDQQLFDNLYIFMLVYTSVRDMRAHKCGCDRCMWVGYTYVLESSPAYKQL